MPPRVSGSRTRLPWTRRRCGMLDRGCRRPHRPRHHDVAHGGVFVGRHEGRVVFVPDTIPGERVRVRLTDVGKTSFWRGEALEVLDASPHRRPHVWRQADIDVPPEQRPGGADFGHIELAHQRELKLAGAARRAAAHRRARPAGRDRAPLPVRRGRRRRRRRDAGRHRLAHAREPARRRRRARRPVRGAQPPRHPGRRSARSRRAAVERAALRAAGGAARAASTSCSPPTAGCASSPRPEAPRRAGAAGRRPRRDPPDAGARGRHRARRRPRVPGRRRRLLAGAPARRALADAARARRAARAAAGRPALDPDAWHLDLYGGVGLFAADARRARRARDARHVRRVRPARHRARRREPRRVGRRARRDRRGSTGGSPRCDAEASAARARAARRAASSCSIRRARVPAARSSSGVADLAPATVVYVACDPVALARDLADLPRRAATTRRGRCAASTCSRTRTTSRRSPSLTRCGARPR